MRSKLSGSSVILADYVLSINCDWVFQPVFCLKILQSNLSVIHFLMSSSCRLYNFKACFFQLRNRIDAGPECIPFDTYTVCVSPLHRCCCWCWTNACITLKQSSVDVLHLRDKNGIIFNYSLYVMNEQSASLKKLRTLKMYWKICGCPGRRWWP